MEVIRNINNNIALCRDSKGREVVAFGKGIGFIKPPQEIPLSRINRTFYNVKDIDCGALRAIPTEMLNIAILIVDYAGEMLDAEFSPTAPITLADHINFAIKRFDEHIALEMPIQEDIRQLYPQEMKVARHALTMIKDMLGYDLPADEAGTIALHFITTQKASRYRRGVGSERITNACLGIIERNLDITVNREDFNCSRFVTHLNYLINRCVEGKQIASGNQEMFLSFQQTYPEIFSCVNDIAVYLNHELKMGLTDEEHLYLMLHVNRLVAVNTAR